MPRRVLIGLSTALPIALAVSIGWLAGSAGDKSGSQPGGGEIADASVENEDQPAESAGEAPAHEWVVSEKIAANSVSGLNVPYTGLGRAAEGKDFIIYSDASGSDGPAVDVFGRDGDGWSLIHQVNRADLPNSEEFRSELVPPHPWLPSHLQMAFHGSTLAVSSLSEGVYVFRKEAGRWVFWQEITHRTMPGSIPSDNNGFGRPIFTASDTFVLPGFTLRVFSLQGDEWQISQEITLDDFPDRTIRHYNLGSVVRVSGDTMVLADTNHALYIFEKNNGRWELRQTISQESNPKLKLRSSYGGWSLQLEGDSLVLGLPLRNLIYVFRKVEGRWVFEQSISRRDLPPLQESTDRLGGEFGSAVAVQNNLMVVTDPWLAAYVFRYSGDQWVWEQTILNPTGPEDSGGDILGPPLLLAGERLVMRDGSDAIYVFQRQLATNPQEILNQPEADSEVPPEAKAIEVEITGLVKAFAEEWNDFLENDVLYRDMEATIDQLFEIDTAEECRAFREGLHAIKVDDLRQLSDNLKARLDYFNDLDRKFESEAGPLFEQYVSIVGWGENEAHALFGFLDRTGFEDFYVDFSADHGYIETRAGQINSVASSVCEG